MILPVPMIGGHMDTRVKNPFYGLKIYAEKDKLSIDASRVSCYGFSIGAMVTDALSLDFQQDLRTVGCYAPANWNICLPTKPRIAGVLQHDGHSGRTFANINSDERKMGGKYCVLTHPETPCGTPDRRWTGLNQAVNETVPIST